MNIETKEKLERMANKPTRLGGMATAFLTLYNIRAEMTKDLSKISGSSDWDLKLAERTSAGCLSLEMAMLDLLDQIKTEHGIKF